MFFAHRANRFLTGAALIASAPITPVSPQAGDKKVELAYDYTGRRIEKKVYDWDDQAEQWEATPSLHRKFVWGGTGGSSASGWLMLLELDCSTGDPPVETVARKYTWGPDLAGMSGQSRDRKGADAAYRAAALQGAGGIGGLLAVDQAAIDYPAPKQDIPAGQYVFYLHDANGNVGQVIDLSAASASAANRALQRWRPRHAALTCLCPPRQADLTAPPGRPASTCVDSPCHYSRVHASWSATRRRRVSPGRQAVASAGYTRSGVKPCRLTPAEPRGIQVV
nr:hypothetical protein fc121 [uncultured bacterium]